MASIEDKRKQRAAFMRALYEVTGGNEHEFANATEIGQVAGVPEDGLTALLNFLEGEYLIEVSWTYGGPGGVQIQHAGVVEVEEGLAAPDAPTQHFAPMSAITIIGNVTGSQIGAAGRDLTQNATFNDSQTDAVRTWVYEYRAALDDLDDNLRGAAAVQLDVVDAELAKPDPHRGLVSGALAALRSFAQSAIGSAGAGAGTLAIAEVVAHWPL